MVWNNWLVLPDASLSTEIPYLKLQIFVRNLFNIKPYGWNGGDDFANLQSI